MAEAPTQSGPSSLDAFAQSTIDAAQISGMGYAGDYENANQSWLRKQKTKGHKAGFYICKDNTRKYADAKYADVVESFENALQGGATPTVGEFIDWFARFPVRTIPGTNAGSLASIARYGFMSAFVDVSLRYDAEAGLFNNIAGVLISVSFEWLIDMASMRLSGKQPEEALLDAFTAVAGMRNSGISKELQDQVNNHFDTIANALETAMKGVLEPGGLELLTDRVGKHLGNELKKKVKELKRQGGKQAVLEFEQDPYAILSFMQDQFKVYNKHKRIGADVIIFDKAIEAAHRREAALIKENEELKEFKKTSAKDIDDQARIIKEQEKNDINAKRYGGDLGAAEAARIEKETQEAINARPYGADVTSAGNSGDLGKTRSWAQKLLSFIGFGSK